MGLSDAATTRILVGFACVQVVFTAAILFGWPALLVVLKDEGQYDELCGNESSSSSMNYSSSSSSSSIPTQRGLAKCNAQEVRLNLIFTVSFIFNAISCLSGVVFDIIGPRLSNLAGGICVMSGILLMTFSDSKGFDGFVPGAAAIGLGGAFSYYANIHVTDLLTTWRTLFLSMFTGLWIAGGLVLCLVQVLYFYAGVPRKTSMICIDCICFLIYFFSVILISPSKRYFPGDKPRLKWFWDDIDDLKWNFKKYTNKHNKIEDESEDEEKVKAREIARSQTPYEEPPDESLKSQLFNLKFLAVVVFCLTAAFYVSYGLGTVPVQLAHLDPTNSVFDVQLFSIIGCFGFLAIPVYGYVVDHFGVAAMGFLWMFIVASWFGLSMVKNVPFQIVLFIWFAFGRASCGTTTANYIRRTFGTKYFATLNGIAWLIGNCSSAIQTPLMDFILNSLGGNFAPVNTACIFIPILGIGVPICSILFVHQQKRSKTTPSTTPHLPELVRSESTMSEIDMEDIISIQSVTPEPDHQNDD